MGWKSTITITRERVIQLIMSRILTATNDELTETLESLGFGENVDLPYFGHNFSIGNPDENNYDREY